MRRLNYVANATFSQDNSSLFISYTIDIHPYLLIRPPFTIVPRGVSLQVLRFCDLVLFYPCSVQHCGLLAMESFAGCLLVCPCLSFHVLSNLLLLLRRLPCTLLMLTSPFVLTARELSRYTCTCSMPIKSLFSTGIYAIILYKEPYRTLLTAMF